MIANTPKIELFLNDVSLGVQKLTDNYDDKIMQWYVPYKKGKLVAKGISSDGSSVQYELNTADKFGGIQINSDKQKLNADGYDVAHVEVQLTDANGIPIRTEDQTVKFSIQGNYRLLGVDNGAIDNVQDIQSNVIKTRDGRCLLIIQSLKGNGGAIHITANVGSIKSETITIKSN